MKADIRVLIRDFIALIYPRNCAGCNQSLSWGEELLCTICKYDLPKTGYHKDAQNPVIRKFYGRMLVSFASAYLHFYKQGITQKILHNFKYRNQPEIGSILGEWYGRELRSNSASAESWDVIIPIPLHPSKEKRRGYNQSNHFASGLSKSLGIPMDIKAVVRARKSETQTHKTREQRWENVEGIFRVVKPEIVLDKHVLLVDDVITTGATLESCGQTILNSGARELSIATLAIAH